jgi:hypothetical protein
VFFCAIEPEHSGDQATFDAALVNIRLEVRAVAW